MRMLLRVAVRERPAAGFAACGTRAQTLGSAQSSAAHGERAEERRWAFPVKGGPTWLAGKTAQVRTGAASGW